MTAACLLVMVALAQAQPGYTISGVVVHGGSGNPLGNVRVYAQSLVGASKPLSVVTGADGKFRFDGLAAGKYRLGAERLGFAGQSYQERSLYQGYSTAVAVGEGQSGENLQFRMIPGAVIYGFVTSPRGDPLPGLIVKTYRVVGSGSARQIQNIPVAANSMTASTDDRGYYRLHSLPEGNYIIAVSGRPHQAPDSDVAEEEAYPVTYYPGVTIAENATLAHAAPGGETHADIIASPLPMLSVRIKAPKSSGSALAFLSVPGPFGSELPYISSQPFAQSQTVFRGVAPGRYFISLHNSKTTLGRKLINVTGPDQEFSIGEVPLPHLTIHLELHGADTPDDRTPITARIQAVDAPYWYANQFKDGFVEFDAIPPGRHEIVILRTGRVPLPQISVAAKGAESVTGAVVTLPETGLVELSIVADAKPVDVPGRLFQGDAPISGRLLMLVPKDDPQNVALYRFDQSDSDGTFSFRSLPPGQYLAFALASGEPGDYRSPDIVRRLMPQGVPVTVDGGKPHEIRLVFPATP